MKWYIILQAMIDPNFFLGYPVQFKNLCQIYPPKVKDIITAKNYALYKKIFLSSQEDIEDDWVEQGLPMEEIVDPFEYLFLMSDIEPRLKQIVIDGFNFFIHESVVLLPDLHKIVIGNIIDIKDINSLRVLTAADYFDFQNTLRRAVGEKEAEPYNPNEHPKVKYFKAKARQRDRIKAKSQDGLNLGSTLAAICCMNLGLNPLNIGELSQVAMSVLIRYYQEKEKYNIDIQSLLAGADSKKVKPQNWIRNIEDL